MRKLKYLIYRVSQDHGTIPCTVFPKGYASEENAWKAVERMLKKRENGELTWGENINFGKAWVVMHTLIDPSGVNIHGKVYK